MPNNRMPTHEAMEDDETDEPETGSSFKID
jgi:hypothetical protein